MPREGTKTIKAFTIVNPVLIEIRYAPGGDENSRYILLALHFGFIEIRYAPGGDENSAHTFIKRICVLIEIRYAPGGDENKLTA